jgi:sphingolipid delta-4 desaturase
MGQRVSRNDFEWVYTEEPHKTRRKLILAKYPQIKELMGHDPRLKYTVTAMVLLQLFSAYLLRDASWIMIAITGYVWGGVINHSMTLAIHEISHNVAFGNQWPAANRAFGIFGNLILGIPYSVQFRKYHQEHHKYQGDEALDMDIPSRFEGLMFQRTGTKFLWVLLQPVFYTLRPLILHPKPITGQEVANLTAQLVFDIIIYYTMGIRSLVYLVGGTFLAMGLHPVAGHFISEHYMFKKGYETYSYYGPLNLITFNVGYHNEHHDFPSIPGCNLPLVRSIAADFYDDLPYHTSWVKVIWDFIFCPEIGPYARVKRRPCQQPLDADGDKDGKED